MYLEFRVDDTVVAVYDSGRHHDPSDESWIYFRSIEISFWNGWQVSEIRNTVFVTRVERNGLSRHGLFKFVLQMCIYLIFSSAICFFFLFLNNLVFFCLLLIMIIRLFSKKKCKKFKCAERKYRVYVYKNAKIYNKINEIIKYNE